MDLKNKLALVTGSAHRVGKGIALSLAEKGTDLIIHYNKSEKKAIQTKEEIEELGSEATVISSNLQLMSGVENLANFIQTEYQDIKILVNSAASFVKKPFLDLGLEDWEKSMHINVRAPFFLTQQLTPLLSSNSIQSEKSLIVNILDLSAVQPWVNFATHAISKASLYHFTKVSARELAPKIRVNGIIPGPILPPVYAEDDEKFWEDTLKKLPLKSRGNPRFIGQTTVFFAENEFVTGAIIPVDGGEGLIGPIPYYKDL